MTRHEIYVNIKETLSKLDLSLYWPGFHACPIALYDETGVSFEDREFPRDERFYGNTAIEFEGQPIAIWNIDGENDPDPELLTADMVHEMFHVFQREAGETRFTQDLKLFCTPWDADFYGLKQRENALLAETLMAADEDVPAMLRTFFGIRRLRAELSSTMEQELLAETGEGMAEFVGCQALMELSPEKFFERMRSYCEKLGSCSDVFDLRHSCYYSGTVLMFAAAEVGIDFRHELGRETRPVSEIIEQMIGWERPDEVVCDLRVKLGMDEFVHQNRREWQKFIEGRESVQGSWFICGYDPMNMTRIEDVIFSSGFIMLQSNETGERTKLMGDVLLRMKHDSHNQVEEYWK